jgi:hypothetical protein
MDNAESITNPGKRPHFQLKKTHAGESRPQSYFGNHEQSRSGALLDSLLGGHNDIG